MHTDFVHTLIYRAVRLQELQAAYYKHIQNKYMQKVAYEGNLLLIPL